MIKKDNIKSQLSFYKSYHNNNINKAIHFICIPMIIISIMLFMSKIYVVNEFYNSKTDFINFIIVIYVISYSKDFGLLIGFIMTIYFMILKFISNISILNNDLVGVNNMSTYLFISGWIFQFIGHYIEGKKPALFTSITQAYYQAPLFSIEFIFPKLFDD